MDKNLFLIYVNEVGKNYKGQYVYEFIFSDSTENIDGEGWDVYPAAGNPEPPSLDFVKAVGKIVSEVQLNVVQNSDAFAVWDAIDGIVALAWEDISEYDSYPDNRLVFKFGQPMQEVIDILYEHDITLELIDKKNG